MFKQASKQAIIRVHIQVTTNLPHFIECEHPEDVFLAVSPITNKHCDIKTTHSTQNPNQLIDPRTSARPSDLTPQAKSLRLEELQNARKAKAFQVRQCFLKDSSFNKRTIVLKSSNFLRLSTTRWKISRVGLNPEEELSTQIKKHNANILLSFKYQTTLAD